MIGGLVALGCAADDLREFAGRELRRVDRLHADQALLDALAQRNAQARRAGEQRADALVEDEHRRALAARGRGGHELRRQRGLARSRRAADERARAGLEPAAEQRIEGADPALEAPRHVQAPVIRGDEAREDHQAAAADGEVVVAALEGRSAVLGHLQAPALRAVLGRQLLEQQHAVGDALDLQVLLGGGAVVEQQHRAAATREDLLERQDLPAKTQRAPRQQAQLRQGVDDHPLGLEPVGLREHGAHGLAQLDLRRVEDRVLLIRLEAGLAGHQLVDVDALQRPAVRGRHRPQLLLGLRQGDVEDPLSASRALLQELQGEGGLPRARQAFDEIQAPGRETPAQDRVQALDSGTGQGRRGLTF